jgi:putative DNA primase/helicase
MSERMADIASLLSRQVGAYRAPWQDSQEPGEAYLPINPVGGLRYKGINAIALTAEGAERGYSDPRWVTASQADAVGGGRRNPLDPGVTLMAWSFQEKVDGKIVQLEKPRLKLVEVFNAEQLMDMPDYQPRVFSQDDRNAAMARIGKSSRANILHTPEGKTRYDQASDTIWIAASTGTDNVGLRRVEAVHQFAHWAGHPDRLDLGFGHPPGSSGHAREELRANMASLFIGDDLGIGFDPGNHRACAGPWRQLMIADPAEVFRAAVAAERIAKDILELSRERKPVELDQEQMQGLARSTLVQVARDTGENAVMLDKQHPAVPQPHAAPLPQDRTYLAVPYAQRLEVKEAGGKWDKEHKAWFAPAGADLTAFAGWIPDRGQIVVAPDQNPVAAFTDALRSAGLEIQGIPVANGKLQRLPVAGDKGHWRGGKWHGESSGSYTFHLDGVPAGYIENFKAGTKQNWKATTTQQLDAKTRAAMAATAAQSRADQDKQQAARYERVASDVQAVWQGAAAAPADHPYLKAKGIDGSDLRVGVPGQTMECADRTTGELYKASIAGRLLVPVKDQAGAITSLQTIDAEGRKTFWPGGKVQGGHHVIGGSADSPWPLIVCEGYATGRTLHAMTGNTVAVAFNAGNLLAVAEAYREKNPNRTIYIGGDNDHAKEGQIGPDGKPKKNVGKTKALEAADMVRGYALIPQFNSTTDRAANRTDWNDLVGAYPAFAQTQLAAGLSVGRARAQEIALAAQRKTPSRERSRQPVMVGHEHVRSGHGR